MRDRSNDPSHHERVDKDEWTGWNEIFYLVACSAYFVYRYTV